MPGHPVADEPTAYRIALGERLQAHIRAQIEPMEDVARRFEVTLLDLEDWISGRAYPDLLFLHRFCQAHGISTDTILSGTNPALLIDLPWSDDETEDATERAALAAAIDESDADPRTVPHEKVRAWMLRLIAGDIDAPPPEPD